MSLILKKEPFKVNTSKVNSIINTSIAKTSHNKSLVDPNGGLIFQLSQQQIHFLNTQLNEIYEVSMFVRNVSQKKQQIRIKKPKSSCLTVTLSKDGIIAPGLDVKIVITYDSKDNERLQDYFTILSQDFQCDVPIHVIPQAGKLEFEPFINFGFIKAGNTKEVTWKISNKCDIITSIQLIPSLTSNCQIIIEPKKIVLQPKAQREIKLKISSNQVGHIQGVIDIEPKLFSVSSADFVANFCQYTRFISDDLGNQITEIPINPLFAGQSVQISANIVNNTPQSCEFRISRKKGRPTENQNYLITPQQFGKDDSQKLISFNPLHGFLEPYQSVPLVTKIQANFTQSDQQLFCNYIMGRVPNLNEQKQFSYTVKVHINQQETPLIMYLKGISVIPKIGLNSNFFNFSDTLVNSKKQKQLRIQNFSLKPVKIVLKNTSNFSFSKKYLKIDPKGSSDVAVTFCPKIVGQINEISPLIVGEFSFPVKLIGKGIFNSRKNRTSRSNLIDNQVQIIKGEQMKVDQMDNTIIQNQISYIKGQNNHKKTSSLLDEANQSTVHFDHSYVGAIDQSMNTNSIYITQHRKSKTLKDRNGKQVKIADSSLLNPNEQIAPYPSQPKNQQQQRMINRQLTSSQLANIEVSQVLLDIGKVYLRSIVKKTFHICNFNAKPISIQLNTNNLECFSDSLQDKQILPSHSWGGLPIKFQALKQGDFKYNLQYIINSKHFFEIILTGTVIQPTLNLSRNQIKFYATEEDKTFQKKQTFVLTNPYEYEVEFGIMNNQENSIFKVEPQNGKILANGNKTLTISHRFDLVQEVGVKLQQTIKIKITHGKTLELKCLSMVPESNCVCKSQQINFKEVAIGKSYQNKIVLKNMSKNFTIYKVIIPKDIQNLVSVSSLSGCLQSEGMQQIIFKIQAFSSMNIDSSISFMIRGGKSIVLPLRANIISPKIRIQNQQIDFGAVPTEGNPATRTLNLINDSQIPIDLEFRLPYDSFLCESLKITKILDQNSQLIAQSQVSRNSSYKSYVLRINPKSRTNILLQFTPQDVTLYQFLLPLFVFNSNQAIPDLQKPCKCKGIKNRIVATQKQINFGKIIIQQNLQSYQKNKILQIKNPQEEPIEWWIDDSNIYPFSLQKNKGKLEGFQKFNLKVFFYSQAEGQYVKDLHIFINQNQTKNIKQPQSNEQYSKITLKASACYPTLYFDRPYVILPVVGLSEESKSVFEIVNGGYENINIKHMVAQQFSNVDLKVNFLEGTNLGVTKKKIKVQVSFKSDKPISFTVKINFYDSNNRIFTIPVSGTADNCIYTITQDPKNTNNFIQQIEKDCNFLRYYISSIGCLQDSLYEFPRSMMQNQFQKLHQFLCHFSSSFEKIRLNLKKNEKNKKFFFNFDYLSEIIRIIKSEGGFLNQIRPEYLLPTHQEYQDAIKLRADNNMNILANYSLLSQAQFQLEQKRSWVIMIYQIFKVYSRINVGKTKNNQFWAKFSAKEKVITNWLQQAYISEAKTQYQKKRSVLQQLSDSELLSALISKYTNIKVLEVYGRQVKGLKQKQRRNKNIIQTFSQIGINCHCRVDDIIRSNPKQMLLILEGLYLILPSYLQKGEPVIFSCALGQTITKSIQISNPSKYPITYMAKIQGPNRAYLIENQQQFIIESKSTHEVKIKYISNINLNNASATLTLTGKASPKFTPSTFIFVLKSQNLGRVSEKNIQVTGQLYQQYEFGINVQNHFESEGEFKVQIQNVNTNKQSPLSFYSLNSVVKIKKGQTITFNMLFIPLILQTQKCFVLFKDPKVGEFQYQITGLVQLPQLSLDVLKIPQFLLTNKKYSINLPIPMKNDNLSKAKKIVESIVDRTEKKTTKTQQNLITADKYFPKINSTDAYSVKIIPANQMVQLRSDTLYIKDIQQKSSQNGQQQTNKQEPKVGLQVNMKMAIKEGSFMLQIRNQSGTDVRRYKVLLNAVYKPLKYELQMKAAVNKLLTQKLPLVNINSQVNTFNITMLTNQASKGIFTLQRQKQVVVPPKTTENIVVGFRPKSQTIYNALIKMENTTTGQMIEYQISGIGEEPDLQVLSFDQQIRQQKVHQIKLPIQKTVKCVVSKFTLEDAVYEKAFIINNTNNSNFKFKYTAKIPGTYEGKLIIQDQIKVYAYKIVINARDLIEQQIHISTLQRKVYKGSITNIPQGAFQVSSNNLSLKFNKNFTSDSKNKGVFNFQHYSTKPEQVQSFLTFKNQKIGQLTYLLKIKVDQMPQFKFQAFKTQLGSRHEEVIKFQNNEEYPIKISGKCTHPKIFFFEPTNIVVPAKSEIVAKLVYVPSKLQLEEGKVNFISERGQKWNYHMSGYGLIQSKPITIQMRGLVGSQKVESISFVNPLQKRVQATIQLQSLQNIIEQPAFKLILKGNKFQLDYQQQLILPILLKPQTVTISKALLVITLSQKIVFKYQLIGISEYFFSQQKFFRLQAKTKKQDIVTFQLPFIQKKQLDILSKAKLKITSTVQSMKQIVKQSIKVIPKEKYIIEDNKISFDIILKAYKPFKAPVQFIVQLPNGCKWIQKYDVSFAAPPPDDKIEIVSEMNKPASMRFKLSNRVKLHTKFKAYFAAPSSTQFTINPKIGELQPFGRQGTPFEITFLPTVYKKEWQAKLIIETEETFWSYQIKGILPPYLPPIAKSLIGSGSTSKLSGLGSRSMTNMKRST